MATVRGASNKRPRSAPVSARAGCASARTSLGGSGMTGALVEAAIEDVLRDTVFEDLDRSAGDHPATTTAHAVLDQGGTAKAGAPHHLQCLVGDLKTDLIAGRLGDGGLVSRGKSAIRIGGGPIEQELRAFELDRNL